MKKFPSFLAGRRNFFRILARRILLAVKDGTRPKGENDHVANREPGGGAAEAVGRRGRGWNLIGCSGGWRGPDRAVDVPPSAIARAPDARPPGARVIRSACVSN